jgi:uncharacterized protein YkwD
MKKLIPFLFGFLIGALIAQNILQSKQLILSKQTSQIDTQIVVSDPLVISLNDERKKYGLSALMPSGKLDESSKIKACDMVDKKYFEHVAPNGEEAWDIMKKVGYKYQHAGENLARYFSNDNDMVKAWMNSKKHKENILDDRYKEIGVGRCGHYVVTHFGTK